MTPMTQERFNEALIAVYCAAIKEASDMDFLDLAMVFGWLSIDMAHQVAMPEDAFLKNMRRTWQMYQKQPSPTRLR
jgi:hypothetical protein